MMIPLFEGWKTVSMATHPESLISTATPCQLVHVAAPVTISGTAVNTKTAWVTISSATGSNVTGFQLKTTDAKGYYIPCRHAESLYVRAGTGSEGVKYTIFG